LRRISPAFIHQKTRRAVRGVWGYTTSFVHTSCARGRNVGTWLSFVTSLRSKK
jgi:hypothetical protein